MLNLFSKTVSRSAVFEVKTPERTETHVPVSHGYFIEECEKALRRHGFDILDSQFTLKADGNDLVFVFALTHPDLLGEQNQVLFGGRNSHIKHFPATCCLGKRIHLCGNGMFFSQFNVARRHTKNVFSDLSNRVDLVVSQIIHSWQEMEKRETVYRQKSINLELGSKMIFSLIETGALNKTNAFDVFLRFQNPAYDADSIVENQYGKEEFVFRAGTIDCHGSDHFVKSRQELVDSKAKELRAEYGDEKTIWSLFNAYTAVMRDSDSTKFAKRTMQALALFDGVCDFNVHASLNADGTENTEADDVAMNSSVDTIDVESEVIEESRLAVNQEWDETS